MAVAVGFSLRQFSEIFKIRDAAGQPYILIGGQAVNYWAEHSTYQVLKLTTNKRARKIANEHQINWRGILPLAAIGQSQDQKIRRFQQQQLEQGYRKSKGISI
jgi:hypothetical protein